MRAGCVARSAGGPYRLDSVRAVRVLELPPGASDSIAKTVTVESVWLFGSCCCEWQGYLWKADDVRKLMEKGRSFEVAPGLRAYVRGDFGFLCAPEELVLYGPPDLDGSILDLGTSSGGHEIFRGEREVQRWDEAQIERLTEALHVPSRRRREHPDAPPTFRSDV